MGAGVSTYYFTNGTAAGHLSDLYDLWSSVVGSMPSSVTVRVPGSGDVMDPLTGTITGGWTGTAPALLTGAAGGAYAAGVGMRVRWYTSTTINGHLVKGSTFFVPLAGGAYEADGSILNTVVTANQTAVNTFLTACGTDLRIWHRGNGTNGIDVAVVSGTLVDRTSWLTSRRT